MAEQMDKLVEHHRSKLNQLSDQMDHLYVHDTKMFYIYYRAGLKSGP